MCSSSRQYQDILALRRDEFSDFMWASRELKPQIAYKQSRKPSPQCHKEEVLKSRKIQDLLTILSEQQNVHKEILEIQVRNILDEIGYDKNLKLIRWLGLILIKIFKNVCSHVYVNKDNVHYLKSIMGACPVIFVPSHRSYADFILMSVICFVEDLAIPAIAAGMDFHGMWGMGQILRETGAFFMRRSYNDDSLYWTTFKQYIYQIVTKGELPVEFFIEGTRSRSNKSLMPKYGLILMILKAFFLSQVPDILFVPINISYERIMEEKLFAFELLGVPKPKETTSAFFKSLSIVKEKFGSIYFDVAKPISVKEFFGSQLDRSVHSLEPIYQQEITEEEKSMIPALAHEIVYVQQKHCVITTFNLLAIILSNNLTNENSLLTIDDISKDLLWLKSIMEVFGAHIDISNVEEGIKEALEVHQNIVHLNSDGKIILVSNQIVLDKFDPNRLKGHGLSEKTLTFSVPFVMLQIYINPTLHYLVDVALLVVVLKYYLQKASQDELFGHYHFLRSLLSQEFVTFSSRERVEFESALTNGLKLHLIKRLSDGFYEIGNNKKLEEVICTTLDCFIYSYFIVCSTLLQIETNVIDEKTITAKVQEEIEIGINDDSAFIHPYSLSLDTIVNCLNALSSQGVLRKSRNKTSILYEIKKPEVLVIRDKLEHCIPSSQALQRKLECVQLHLKNKL